jgi:hypothetical protein
MAILYLLMTGTSEGPHPALEVSNDAKSKESAHASD